MTFFLLVGGEVIGWCFRNLSHQPDPNQSSLYVCAQPEVTIFSLSGNLSSVEALRDLFQIVVCLP